MMDWTPEKILAALEPLGVTLRVTPDGLVANPRSCLTQSLAEAIRQHKDELMRLLTTPSAADDDSHLAHDRGVHPASDGQAAPEPEPMHYITAKIPVVGTSGARGEAARLIAAAWVRSARKHGLGVALGPDDSIFLSALPDRWEATQKTRAAIEDNPADAAAYLAQGCRWCGRTDVALDVDRLCVGSKCRDLARWLDWPLTEETPGDAAYNDARARADEE